MKHVYKLYNIFRKWRLTGRTFMLKLTHIPVVFDSGNMYVSNDSIPTNETTQEVIVHPEVYILLATLVLAIGCLAIAYNLLICYVIVKTSNLHTQTNAIIVSLTLGDLCTGLFVMPVLAIQWYIQDIVYSAELCSFVSFMTSLTTTSKSLNMMAVSLDRCVAVSYPLQYSSIVTRTTTAALLVYVWTMSVTFACLPFLAWDPIECEQCHGIYGVYRNVPILYSRIEIVLCCIVPVVVIVVAMVIIVMKARSHNRIIAIAQLTIAVHATVAGVTGANYHRQTFKAMRTYLIISITYLFSGFPLSLYNLVITTNRYTHSETLFPLLTILSFISTVTTAVIIATLNGKFKESIHRLCERNSRGIRTDETTHAFTVTTGLQSILEKSMIVKCVSTIPVDATPNMENDVTNEPELKTGKSVRFVSDDQPGPSRNMD